MSNEVILKALANLAAAFDVEVSEARFRAYLMGLADLPDETVVEACRQSLLHRKFFPTVAELRELTGHGQQDVQAMALQAWAVVDKAADEVGSYRAVDFEDPVINAAIRTMGGWPEILARAESDWHVWGRKEFLAAYQACSRMRGGEICAALPGLGAVGEQQRADGALIDCGQPEQVVCGYLPAERRRLSAPELTGESGKARLTG